MRLLALFVCTFICFSVSAQKETEEKVWKLLLNNDRKAAIETLDQLAATNAIEPYLLRYMLRMENADMVYGDLEDDFFEEFATKKDYDYYLYALWNEQFVFSDYLSNGFDVRTYHGIEVLHAEKHELPLVTYALEYLKSISARRKNRWDAYADLNNAMPFIQDWQYCGVFENLNNSGLDVVYPPENVTKSTKGFNANSNGIVNWYEPGNNEPQIYKFQSNHDIFGSGVHYAQTFIKNEEARRVVLRMGVSGTFKVWLNDVLILQSDKEAYTDIDAHQVAVNLPAGQNRLLVKLANEDVTPYIAVRFTDEANNPLEKVSYHTFLSSYTKSDPAAINAEELVHPVEAYFRKKLEQDPDNYLYTYCLTQTYLRNQKYEEAKEVMLPLYKKYPKSSLLRSIMIEIYSLEGDETTVNEIQENMELDDPYYYLSLLGKIDDFDMLMKMDINKFNEYMQRIDSVIQNDLFKSITRLVTSARLQDMTSFKKDLEDLVVYSRKFGNTEFLLVCATAYVDVFNDQEKAIALLEESLKTMFDYKIISKLASLYHSTGRKDDAIEVWKSIHPWLKDSNSYLGDLIDYLHAYERYEASLPYIEQRIQNFPFDFVAYKLKGNALLALDRKKEALVAYRQSLHHNPENSELRKKIADIEGVGDPLTSIKITDAYERIKTQRGKTSSNNYGYNVLLHSKRMVLYPETGGKANFVYIYEVTSDNGINIFKEYNLGLSGNYQFEKFEIVKPDGSVVPADRNGSSFVFNDLAIGDVVHFDFDIYYSGSGRFYKDFVDYFRFDYFAPTTEVNYQLLIPKERELNYKVMNGELDFRKEKSGDYVLYEWNNVNDPGLPRSEDYLPEAKDYSRYLHLSTIASWDVIAQWYSDLVRTRMVSNSEVDKVFTTLFPDPLSTYSDEEKAKKIYEYMMDHLNYSHVSFRQSGYVPQKPSKTLNTGLGDCKDLSTLFVILAQKAGLEANLVLISTSDNGKHDLVLPSQHFNHCIVKVVLDGSEQFLELTNKYLSFKSLPTSLHGATALEIPLRPDGKKYDLFKLEDPKRKKAVRSSQVTLTIGEEAQQMELVTDYQGHAASFYAKLLSEENKEVLKKKLEENLESLIPWDYRLDTYQILKFDKLAGDIKLKRTLTIDKKVDQMGSIKFFKLPDMAKVYTSDIIASEQREFPINYSDYEHTDQYEVIYDVHLQEGSEFVEIPKSQKLSFKSHRFEITFEKLSQDHLKVGLLGVPGKQEITPEEYKDFKVYVKQVLEAIDQFIGFKSSQ
ncbi:transglutaminase domain-containing protein [Flavobacteriaceae bacterium M23B6Z8]